MGHYSEITSFIKNKLIGTWNSVNEIIFSIFSPNLKEKHKGLQIGWILSLYIFGILLWAILLRAGDFNLDFHDWVEINGPRLAFIQKAMIEGRLPLHMSPTVSLHGITDRFLALPDVITTPQMIFLLFFDFDKYVFINTLLLYTLSTLGLLWLRDKYKISLYSYSVLFLLFNFNGHIESHIVLGHITWGGYFLFPWFIALILDYLQGDEGWRWVAKLSFLLFFMVLQGSEHHFVWILIFLAGLAIVLGRRSLWLIIAMVFSVLINAIRLLPPVLEVGHFKSSIRFLGGYPLALDVLTSMASLPTNNILSALKSNFTLLNYWEFDLYVGVLGSAFILFFGVNGLKSQIIPALNKLTLPIALLFFLSIGNMFWFVRILPIPLFAGERATSRMIILPFVFLLFCATANYQSWLDSKKLSLEMCILQLIMLSLIVNDILKHTILWNINNIKAYFPVVEMNFSTVAITNHADAAYTFILACGAIITIVTSLMVLFLASKKHS